MAAELFSILNYGNSKVFNRTKSTHSDHIRQKAFKDLGQEAKGISWLRVLRGLDLFVKVLFLLLVFDLSTPRILAPQERLAALSWST